MSPELIAEIHAYTTGIIRAAHEYRLHPFAKSSHGVYCASHGCPSGLQLVAARRGRMS